MGFSVLGFRGLGFEVQGAGLLRIEKGFDRQGFKASGALGSC